MLGIETFSRLVIFQWNNQYQRTIKTDLSDRDRTHWGVNIFKNVTKQLSFGLEVGNFEMAEVDADSNYMQFSAKYVL